MPHHDERLRRVGHALAGQYAGIASGISDADHLVDAKLATAHARSAAVIRGEFAIDSPYSLMLNVREDGFDPAAVDPLLPALPVAGQVQMDSRDVLDRPPVEQRATRARDVDSSSLVRLASARPR